MRDETRGFVTGVQKSFLSNDESLSIESYRLMHSRGKRIRRFDNLSRWLNEDPIDGKSGYAHSWSSLSATSDGKRVVTLDYRGKPRWHDILENGLSFFNGMPVKDIASGKILFDTANFNVLFVEYQALTDTQDIESCTKMLLQRISIFITNLFVGQT